MFTMLQGLGVSASGFPASQALAEPSARRLISFNRKERKERKENLGNSQTTGNNFLRLVRNNSYATKALTWRMWVWRFRTFFSRAVL
jgi:hypothetical protein